MKILFEGSEDSLVGRICRVIYDLCYWIDQKRGKIDQYSYHTDSEECTLNYGHRARLTWSDYNYLIERRGHRSAKFRGIIFNIPTHRNCCIAKDDGFNLFVSRNHNT